MPEKTSYQPGEPIWVDLATPDQPASAAFYGELLGWAATTPQPEFGNYANFLLEGRKVAGLVPLMAPGQPPSWTCYICTDDADKTAALAQQAGGAIVAPAMDVADLGRMTLFTDPGGALLGAWQPGTHIGAELAGEAGTVTWIELAGQQPSSAKPFYETTFGWSATSNDYVEFQVGGTSVAGCTDVPQGTSGWLPYFATQDPAAAAERAQALGGSIVLPHVSFDGGSCSIVRDPHGAAFGLLSLS